jgi:hypothetical protein
LTINVLKRLKNGEMGLASASKFDRVCPSDCGLSDKMPFVDFVAGVPARPGRTTAGKMGNTEGGLLQRGRQVCASGY